MTYWTSLLDQLAIFPLHPVVTTPDGPRCGCTRPDCPTIGKHPAALWSELGAGEKWRSRHDESGYGIATGIRSGLFVVDLDGEEAIRAFFDMGDVPDTFTVERGFGRIHFYYRLPDFLVKTSAGEVGDGIDVRGEGGFIVAPGSPHKSGIRYEIIIDAPLADAPAWLLALPCLRRTEEVAGPIPTAVEANSAEEAELIEEAIKMLASAPPAIAGSKGHGTLWIVAQRLVRSFELPTETAYRLLQQHYNPRCIPAWSERELRHKLEQARDNGRFELRSQQLRFNRGLLAQANADRTAP